MKFISEELIDKVVVQLEQDEALYDIWLSKYSEDQEDVFVFYQSENFSLLLQEEYDLLIFMTIVLFESSHQSGSEVEHVNIQDFEKNEEKNWEIFQESAAKDFRDKITPFFDSTNQEDLLAFVEDTLVLEEEDVKVTAVGREVLFLTLCSLIECLE